MNKDILLNAKGPKFEVFSLLEGEDTQVCFTYPDKKLNKSLLNLYFSEPTASYHNIDFLEKKEKAKFSSMEIQVFISKEAYKNKYIGEDDNYCVCMGPVVYYKDGDFDNYEVVDIIDVPFDISAKECNKLIQGCWNK